MVQLILWNGQKSWTLNFKLSTQNLKNMFFLDPESKYEKIFILTMCLSSLFYKLWSFENCKMYSNVLKIHF